MSYTVQHLGFLDSLSSLVITGQLIQILSRAFVPAMNKQEPQHLSFHIISSARSCLCLW